MENIKIDRLIKSYIKENKLEDGLENIEVNNLWYETMKNGVANYTTDLNLKNGTLYIKLKSSALREELSYGKEKIIKLLNEKLKKDLIKKIVLR
ncbi:MAG: DciA family protein [Bacteroidota bacterium]|nr:DciA family protein [Bacteroidota bacterium]|tara:strand:- start:604 stop:885 length:282 start_codon:yes stop_codon:yes gene_type:complete